MLGAIIGDMVGSPYEFHPWRGAAEAFPLFSPRSRFTDDTVMTVAVGRALMRCEGAREMRIFRKRNENVPEHFLCFGTFFE